MPTFIHVLILRYTKDNANMQKEGKYEIYGAGDGARTRDFQLGKLTLYH